MEVLQLRRYRELVGVHVLTLALGVVKRSADGQLPEDSVTCAWDADLQEAGMLDRTRRVSRLVAKTRRDEWQTHRERRIHDVEDCALALALRPWANPRYMVERVGPLPARSGLQARICGNALGSLPSLVRVPS